jgi:stearoyl-CoA desaturase (delta-9 desaturase)
MEKMSQSVGKRSHIFMSIVRWFDSYAGADEIRAYKKQGVDWFRVLPFVALHGMCLGVIWVGWSWFAILVTLALYAVRMFAITAFYHRYFSHNAFRTSRPWRFAFAVLGNSAVQRGPLWWASHHRHHHKYADTEKDVHSPLQHGFLWSHMGWLTSSENFPTRMELVPDWARYPELRWIDRFDMLIPLVLAFSLYVLGVFLESYAPGLETNGAQLLIWGFFVSSVLLFHTTATINSLDHMIGNKRYRMNNESRNSFLLALITLGEGWHNNHHHYAVSARQGFYWWEIDITYYLLLILSWIGIIRDLHPLPSEIRERNLIGDSEVS